MGTPKFAIPAIDKLLNSPFPILAVYTQPDKPAGRGQQLTPPPVKIFALEHSLPVYQPPSLKDSEVIKQIKELNPDVIIVSSYGKIIPPDILNIPRFGCINIHPSLLPKYRGAAPIQRAIMNGDLETGVSIMQIEEGLDSGPVILQEKVPILDDDDAESLSNMLSVLGTDLLLNVLNELDCHGSVKLTPQNDSEATYASKIEKSEGLLDWSLSNEKIICQIKGLIPTPCAYSFLRGKRFKFLRAQPYDPLLKIDKEKMDRILPGTIIALPKKEGIVIKTGDGFLLLTRLQMEGKKSCSGVELLLGRLITLGDRFENEGLNSNEP